VRQAQAPPTSYQISQVYGGGLIPIVAGVLLHAYGIHQAYIDIGLFVMVYAPLPRKQGRRRRMP